MSTPYDAEWLEADKSDGPVSDWQADVHDVRHGLGSFLARRHAHVLDPFSGSAECIDELLAFIGRSERYAKGAA